MAAKSARGTDIDFARSQLSGLAGARLGACDGLCLGWTMGEAEAVADGEADADGEGEAFADALGDAVATSGPRGVQATNVNSAVNPAPAESHRFVIAHAQRRSRRLVTA